MRRLTGLDNIVGPEPEDESHLRSHPDHRAAEQPRADHRREWHRAKNWWHARFTRTVRRSSTTFITINCGAFPETLLESELFGYVKGAFTGANENRRGLFQAAHGGTLFLDEIGNMNLAMQVKLYRVLQEGKVRPLGSTEEIDVDVRVIAATNRDLEKAIASGDFREDLFYRLSVIPLHLPSLRERREDIPLLARYFLESFRKSMDKPIEAISPQAMSRLETYDWPGNVRELENTIERAVALESGSEISTTVLPDRISGASVAVVALPGEAGSFAFPAEGIDFEGVMAETEKRYLRAALDKADGVRTHAAELLKSATDRSVI